MAHALWSDSPKSSSALFALAERSRSIAPRVTPLSVEDSTMRRQRPDYPAIDAGITKNPRVPVKTDAGIRAGSSEPRTGRARGRNATGSGHWQFRPTEHDEKNAASKATSQTLRHREIHHAGRNSRINLCALSAKSRGNLCKLYARAVCRTS